MEFKDFLKEHIIGTFPSISGTDPIRIDGRMYYWDSAYFYSCPVCDQTTDEYDVCTNCGAEEIKAHEIEYDICQCIKVSKFLHQKLFELEDEPVICIEGEYVWGWCGDSSTFEESPSLEIIFNSMYR